MKPVVANLRAKFVAGVVVTVPVIATVLALRFLFRQLDSLLGPLISNLVGRDLPGLGLLATLVIVLLVGLLATNFLGRRLLAGAERVFTELPVVRRIYNASKDIVQSAALARRQVFQEVVMAEYPRTGLHSYGFVTSYTVRQAADGPTRLANVFIPGPPIPTTGVLVAIPVDQLYYLDMSVEQALKLVLSVGMTAPAQLRQRTRAVSSGHAPGATGEGSAPPLG